MGQAKPAGQPKRPADLVARAHAEKLAKDGMPIQMALAVAYGKMSLGEAVQRMSQRDAVNRLMEKHTLSRALATQIVLGQASIDVVLAARRLDDHRTQFRNRSVLDEAQATGTPVTLLVHGQRRLTGKVLLVDNYMLRLELEEGGTEDLHKLQVKVAFAPDAYKKVRKTLKFDKTLEKAPIPPVAKPQDRYTCSDKRLFRYMDEAVEVTATTLEGEMFKGHVQWFSRYEFGMKLKGDTDVTLFRHALHDLSE
jgi:sRNA-binding regulator protein Hfq